MSISDLIYNEGMEIGYSRIGALLIDELVSFQAIEELKVKHSNSKSLIIGVWHYNFNKIPEHIQHSKSKLFKGRYLKDSHENDTAIEFETFLQQHDINYVDVTHLDHQIKNKIAEKMAIGIIRKNGFFYTEEGSYCTLHVWLVDDTINWKHDEVPDPCPGHCGICVKTCPEQAIDEGYSKDYNKCIDFDAKELHLEDNKIKVGCDVCQDNCPYNKHRWAFEEEFVNLDY